MNPTRKQHDRDDVFARYNIIEDSPAPPSSDNHHYTFEVSVRVSGQSNVRDSLATQKSVSSSSLYPPSTSTVSGTDSTCPHSILDQSEPYDIPTFEPEIDEVDDFDGDDVAYRLRLLMKNNYFLPPAHSKPSISDLAQAAPNGVKKPTTPTFLDLFRVGRSKPRPSTPNSPPDPSFPVLRTTSDPAAIPGTQSRLSPTPLSASRQMPASPTRVGRVVVVREKMSDLASAAKQAEQEMKTRNIRREQGSQRGQKDMLNDVIDPTDAVDLPPPVAGYPFPVQASALHGLGVEDSVGAAILAEQLPPPNSPGMSMLSPEEYAWRKALLREAVGHSLQNSPEVSTTSPSPAITNSNSNSIDSSHLTDMGTPSHTPSRRVSVKRALGQRIIAQPLIEELPIPSPRLRINTGRRDRGLASPDSNESTRQSYLPRRAETPAAPPTPLAPPPRRQIANPLYSLSQTDLSRTSESRTSTSSHKGLRRTVSSPRLSDAYEADIRQSIPMTPPPLPAPKMMQPSIHSRFDSSFETNRALASQATTTDSHYSEEDNAPPRHSTSMSIPTIDRPSLSDYSQPSPTASAFQDALDYQYYSSSPNPPRSSENEQPVTPQVTNVNPAPRYSTMSPPPRVSSSLANVVLSPPPRSTSLTQRSLTRLPTSTVRSAPLTDATHPSSAPPVMVQDFASPFSVIERRDQTIPLTLQIPSHSVPVAIRSAPPPASPIAFFDDIQMHPNAMDDLDSSSDEDDGDHTPIYPPDLRTRSTSNLSLTSARPLVMRMGNHSSPHVARSYERGPSLPIGPISPSKTFENKKPVGNVVSPAPFFQDKRYSKSDQGHGPPVSVLDIYRLTQQRAVTTEPKSPRPSMSSTHGVPVTRAWQTEQRVRDSLRRLDGMLIQHMETERNTIKRIASSARQTNT